MRSMTGFGSASLVDDGLSLRVEVRAVNHRFLQVKTRLPGELGFLEADVERRVRKRVERGALSITVVASGGATLRSPAVHTEVAREYQRKLAKLGKELGLSGEVGLELLAGLPGVITGELDERGLAREGKLVLKALDEALESLELMRAREGAALAKDLARSAKAVRAEVKKIAARSPKLVREHQAALEKRLAELLEGRNVRADADLSRELALIADRTDVSEELSRLESHLEQLAGLLEQDGPVGRKLDFLVQEFLREANTIGSKCNDAEVAHMVVELKTWIERLREQVQNLE